MNIRASVQAYETVKNTKTVTNNGFFPEILSNYSNRHFSKIQSIDCQLISVLHKKAPDRSGAGKLFWRLLFAYHFKFDFGAMTATKVDGCFISSQFFYFINDVDLAAINCITFLLIDSAAQLE